MTKYKNNQKCSSTCKSMLLDKINKKFREINEEYKFVEFTNFQYFVTPWASLFSKHCKVILETKFFLKSISL